MYKIVLAIAGFVAVAQASTMTTATPKNALATNNKPTTQALLKNTLPQATALATGDE